MTILTIMLIIVVAAITPLITAKLTMLTCFNLIDNYVESVISDIGSTSDEIIKVISRCK